MGKSTDILKKLLCAKKIKEDNICWQTVFISKQDVICFNLSTNPLLGFEKDGQLWFFRECPPKGSPEQYVQTGIARFFAYINNNQVEKLNFAQDLPIEITFDDETVADFLSYISTRKKDPAFLAKLSKAYVTLNKAGYSIWAENNTVPQALFDQIGLTDLREEWVPIARYFLWCMRATMACLDTQKAAKGKRRYYYNALRAFSTEIVAKHLGIESLVTQSTWCRLEIDDDVRFGVLSKAAAGKRAADMKGALSGKIQRDLTSLHVLDVLCFQQDHGPNNYNIIQWEDAEATVCAFDNDNPNTFFPLNTVSMSLAGCAPLVTEGCFNRPYICKQLAETLLQLDGKQLIAELKPWLNKLQQKALLGRLQQLKTAIQNSNAVQLADGDWNEETLQKELTGAFGKTYLVKLSEQMQ